MLRDESSCNTYNYGDMAPLGRPLRLRRWLIRLSSSSSRKQKLGSGKNGQGSSHCKNDGCGLCLSVSSFILMVAVALRNPGSRRILPYSSHIYLYSQ
ncbi:hypothetical protein FF1_009150 [Malus domestica]